MVDACAGKPLTFDRGLVIIRLCSDNTRARQV